MLEPPRTAALPFESGSFDVALCQAALMFLPDRTGALGEMARAATDGGTIAVQVWDRLEAQAGFGAMYEAFTAQLGPAAAELESSYWVLGDLGLVGSLFEAAGLRVTGTRTRVGIVRFASAEEAVATELQATPLAERIDPDAYRRVLEVGIEAMRPFVVDGGRVELPIGGHLVTGVKAGWARRTPRRPG